MELGAVINKGNRATETNVARAAEHMLDDEELMDKRKARKKKQEILELSSHHETLEGGC
jgi:hypothetical protein